MSNLRFKSITKRGLQSYQLYPVRYIVQRKEKPDGKILNLKKHKFQNIYINLRSGRILASLSYSLTLVARYFSFHRSRLNVSPSETKIEPDRRLHLHGQRLRNHAVAP